MTDQCNLACPICYADSGAENEAGRDRYTLTEVRRAILEQSNHFQPEDILPVPCHPDCLAMAYALKAKGQVIPLTSLISPEAYVEAVPNSILYEQSIVLTALLSGSCYFIGVHTSEPEFI